MSVVLKKERDLLDWFPRLKNVDVAHETCFNMKLTTSTLPFHCTEVIKISIIIERDRLVHW